MIQCVALILPVPVLAAVVHYPIALQIAGALDQRVAALIPNMIAAGVVGQLIADTMVIKTAQRVIADVQGPARPGPVRGNTILDAHGLAPCTLATIEIALPIRMPVSSQMNFGAFALALKLNYAREPSITIEKSSTNATLFSGD